MTNTTVSVTIQEDPLPVLIDTGTPQITITENSGNVTVIEASPVYVSAAEGNPRVIVNNGGYAGTVSVLLEDLIGKLTRTQMSSSLASDLERLESLWLRIGNELLLTYPEGVEIQEAGRTYTDSSITDAVADITVSVDGKLDIAYSYIDQTASAITQQVTQVEGDVNDRMTVAESLISQTANQVETTVTRLDNIDGPGGDIELLQSSINQTASDLILEVTARQEVAGELLTAQTNLSLLSDSVSLMATSLNTLDDRVSTSEIILGADGINLTVLQTALADHEYSIGTMQLMLTNKWAVNIEEDVNGNTYTTGFGLLLHPVWLIGEEYAVDDTVISYDVVYQCILANTANATNAPSGDNGSTYWLELPDGVKTEFTVQADAFKIWTSDGLQPVFTVTDGKAVLNGALAAVSLESTNYGTAGEPWFKLDSETGLAEFNNMVAVFGSGSSGYENLSDAPNVSTSSRNLLPYGDFQGETNATTNPTGWDNIGSGYTYNQIYRTTSATAKYRTPWKVVDEPVWYTNIPDAASYGGIRSTEYIAVNPNDTYCLSCWLYQNSGGRSYLGIRCYDSSETYLGYAWILSSYQGGLGKWEQQYGSFVPSDFYTNVAYIKVQAYVQYQCVGLTMMSRIQLVQGAKPVPWDMSVSTNGANWLTNVANKPTLGALAALSEITDTEITSSGISAQKINCTTLAAFEATTGNLNVDGSLIIYSGGALRSSGKTSYADTTPGFFIGYDSGYCISIGDADYHIKYRNGSLILNGEIIATNNVNDNAITNVVSSFTAASTTVSSDANWTTIQTAQITSTGKPVQILARLDFDNPSTLHDVFAGVRILRNSTELCTLSDVIKAGNTWYPLMYWQETLTSGTSYTYYLQVYKSSAADPTVSNRILSLMEVKK